MNLTTRFEEALVYAFRLHAQQRRKGSGIPYFSHLLGTCELVLENGGNEDQAIAALLHDAVEDRGGKARFEEISERFGEAVAIIVDGCSDTDEIPKPPWLERKKRYLEHLSEVHPDVLLVSCADKLNNVRAITRDLRSHGEAVWDRFKGKKDGTLWNYRALVKKYREIADIPIVEELARALEELERVASEV